MSKEVNWNANEIHLNDYSLRRLPDSPNCPNLVKLCLQVPSVPVIPRDFFKRMHWLEVLDLSNTSVAFLPTSISCLSNLREFFLRDCPALIELPPDIGSLSKLKLFDINGTDLMLIPKEIGKLEALEVFRVSFSQYAKSYIGTKEEDDSKTVIPRKMISDLKQLKELSVTICVGGEPEWWKEEVGYLQKELCDLQKLKTLRWHLPTKKILKEFILLERNHVPIYSNLSNLMLTVGQHAQLTSCLPRGLEKRFQEFENYLKWINAEGNVDDISKIMPSVEALFLSRHLTIKKLSDFNVVKLKYCLIAECHDMEALVEADKDETRIKNGEKVGLKLLEYLSIHYMDKLQSIWKGPIGEDSLSKLKILALHTCPELTFIFTLTIAQNLLCLTELTVQDCPKLTCLISKESHNIKSAPIFPSLESIFLLKLPELVHILADRIMLKKLRTFLIHNCLQLQLTDMELPCIIKIEGENEWWNKMVNKPLAEKVFVPLKEPRDLAKQLFDATNSLAHFDDTPSEYEKESSNLINIEDLVITAETSTEKGKGIYLSIEETEDNEDNESYGWTHSEAHDTETDTFSSSFSEAGRSSLSRQGSSNMISLDIIESFGNRVVDDTASENNAPEARKIKLVQEWLGSLSKTKDIITQPMKKEPTHIGTLKNTLITEPKVVGVISRLISAMKHVRKSTVKFDGIVRRIQDTLYTLSPLIESIEGQNMLPVEEMEILYAQLKSVEELVLKCQRIKSWNFYKKYSHVSKMNDLNRWFLKFIEVHLQSESENVVASSKRLPNVPHLIIGLDYQLEELKEMVLMDSPGDDCSVVVISGMGGCGKTALVTMLCNDSEIKGKFGRNIFFTTISSTFNLQNIIRNLLGNKTDFTSDEDAISMWRSFLSEYKSEVLLILDDVLSDHIIQSLEFKLPGYKIVVTSRTIFLRYRTIQMQPLNHQDATNLFRVSAHLDTESKSTHVPDDLVDQIVKLCGNHPLALTVVGGSLAAKPMVSWQSELRKLLVIKESVYDLEPILAHRLAMSLNELPESSTKQCFLDLGLFPEDREIAAATLMDMWVHLYKHDEEGSDTSNILFELSSRKLATLLRIRKSSSASVNYCEGMVVKQHDMLRLLAIQLSSKEPVELRKRLIIGADGLGEFPSSGTVNAHLLSVSADEIFSLQWDNIQFPKVEVFILNIMSKVHPLPQLMQNMERLKVLIITNYGSYFSDLQDFPAPQYLPSLTTIRLEHVSVSLIIASLLDLGSLHKLSLIRCKIGNSFDEWTLGTANKLPRLMEIYIDSCDDLAWFPATLCNLVHLKILSITYCRELTSISNEFGKLSNLEVLQLASCSKLTKLPESMRNLKKLRIFDLSHCKSLLELPMHIGELCCLRTINVNGCIDLQYVPDSVRNLQAPKVVCDEERSYIWIGFANVQLELVQQVDQVNDVLKKIMNA